MPRPFILLAALALAALPAHALNKCVGKDGKVAYQDAPCDADAKASKPIAPPASDNASSGPIFEEGTTDDHVFDVAAVESTIQTCSAKISDFGRRQAAAINAWRASRPKGYALLNSSSKHQETLRTMIAMQVPVTTAASCEEFAAKLKAVFQKS
jgi:hypothetical protein